MSRKAEARGLFQTLAVALSRTAAQTRRFDDPAYARRRVVLMTVFLALLLGPPAAWHLARAVVSLGGFDELVPNVSVTKESERLTFLASPAHCGPDARLAKGCLANPANDTIYRSQESRADPNRLAIIGRHQGDYFWIGIEVDPLTLRKALDERATRFVLGFFEATYRVWVDGQQLLGTYGWHESELVAFSVSPRRLATGRPLRIAIELLHNEGSTLPDQLNSFAGLEGFYTESRFQSYAAHIFNTFKIRPFTLFLAYTVLAIAFFSFWAPAPVKQEYFFIGLLALVCGFSQARMTDTFFTGVDSRTGSAVRALLDGFVATSGLLLALSFARTRRRLMILTAIFAVAMPPVAVLLTRATPDLIELAGAFRTLVSPVFYAFGALVCLLQARLVLRAPHVAPEAARLRALRLVFFALGLIALASVYHWLLPKFWHGRMRAWHGVETFALIAFLGTIALRELRAQARAAHDSPVSEYHRREVPPERITGALLIADLVDTSLGPVPRSLRSQLVGAWRAQLSAAVLRFGGVVVHHKGDELIVFFDEEHCDSPLLAALGAMEASTELASGLDLEFAGAAPDLRFRAALVQGSIRPVWENVAGQRQAYWEEAGETTPFVEAARLLEMDPAADGRSHVVMTEVTAAALTAADNPAPLGGRFALRAQAAHDKHGNPYALAVFTPGPGVLPFRQTG